MPEDVLRHPERPAVDARAGAASQRRRGTRPRRGRRATSSSSASRRDVAPSEAPGVDAQEHGLLGRPVLPLLRRPGAREHVAALGARHDVAVAVERDDVGSREPERHDDGRRVRDLRVRRGELAVELGEELRRRERGRREDDAVGGDRLAVLELDVEAARASHDPGDASARCEPACASRSSRSASTSAPIPARSDTNGGRPDTESAESPRSTLPCSSSSARSWGNVAWSESWSPSPP